MVQAWLVGSGEAYVREREAAATLPTSGQARVSPLQFKSNFARFAKNGLTGRYRR